MTAQPPPEAVYASLHRRIGGRLFTATVLDRAAGLARRVYSSDPAAYPVSGTKPMGQGEWTVQVVERGEVFVANTVAEFAGYFADHALIESLGCGAALNIPVKGGPDMGAVVGTVNILDEAGHFSVQRVQACIAHVEADRAALLAAMTAPGTL